MYKDFHRTNSLMIEMLQIATSPLNWKIDALFIYFGENVAE